MPGTNIPLVFAASLLGFAGAIAIYAQGGSQAPAAADPSQTRGEPARTLAKGKEIFAAAGCVNCHNATGDKPLKSGLPLNERGLSTEDIARAVNGRLKNKTEDERRAMTLYIASLMKPQDSEAKAPAKP
jgi:mono/diheme cytochrome c family protein